MFTLSGAHVFPMYDGAVKAEPPMRLLDVRHEQTAAFAAEATGKLTRVPGLAVLTAGPGVTNGVSAIAQAQFAGSPDGRGGWAGTGQPVGQRQPPGARPGADRRAGAKHARTLHTAGDVLDGFDEAFTAARPPIGARPSWTCRWTSSSTPRAPAPSRGPRPDPREPDPDAIAAVAPLLGDASRPVLILGTDVWADGAEEAALRLVEALGLPTITNGMGRGLVPGGHPLLVTKARGQALGTSDLVVVVGTPLDFRLGYGVFGGKEGAPRRRGWSTSPTPPARSPATRSSPAPRPAT